MAQDLFDPEHPKSIRDREILIRRSIFDSDNKDRLVRAACELVDTLARYGAYADHELPAELMQAYHVVRYDGEVQNGGHAQYIGNSGWEHDVVADVERGLAAMKADDYLALFRSVRALVDSGGRLKDRSISSRGFSDLGEGRPHEFDDHDSRFYALSRDRGLRYFIQEWLRGLDIVRVVRDGEWLGELNATILANPLRQARRVGAPDLDFSAECFPRTELEKQAYQQVVPLCGTAGCELVRVQSAGWAQGLGLLFLEKALDKKAIVNFAGRKILMGVLDTDKGELYVYSTRRASVLVDPDADKVLAEKIHPRSLLSRLFS